MATAPPVSGRSCLSIQSHVVHGYVGNKCAVFPLQLMGFDVSPINSVQFSNHTAYPRFRGEVLDGDALRALAQGLEENGLMDYSHMLTGYMRNASFLRAVLDVLRMARKHNEHLVYVCDPVLGDDGKLYVPEELVGIYREEVIRHATMVTPNQFEAEMLSGVAIRNVRDAASACDWFHAQGVRDVVITSMDIAGPRKLLVMTSSVVEPAGATAEGETEGDDWVLFGERGKWRCVKSVLDLPKYEAAFTGTGDLLTALLLAWRERFPSDLARACEHAVSTVQGICRRTFEGHAKELLLIPSRDLIERPPLGQRMRTVSAAEREVMMEGTDPTSGARE